MNKNLHLQFLKASNILNAVNNRIRLQIIELIRSTTILNASQVAQQLSLSYEDTKSHMLILMRAGIVEINRESDHSFYVVNADKVFKIKSVINELAGSVYK